MIYVALFIWCWLGRKALYCQITNSFWSGCPVCWIVRGAVVVAVAALVAD